MKKTDESKRVSYLHRHLVKETRLMRSIATELEKQQKAIQLAPYEGQLLSTLVALRAPKVSLEIGTLYGYSAGWILDSLDRSGKLYTVEFNEENYKQAVDFLNKHEKNEQVEVIKSSGIEALESWPSDRSIDFLFLDADKGNYLNYLELAMPHLSKGALVVADNSFLFGYVLEDSPPVDYSKNTWRSMRRVNEVLSGVTGDFKGMAIPTLQGMTVGVKL